MANPYNTTVQSQPDFVQAWKRRRRRQDDRLLRGPSSRQTKQAAGHGVHDDLREQLGGQPAP
jgi:hypothetical protein